MTPQPRGSGRWGAATPLREWMRAHGATSVAAVATLARELRTGRSRLQYVASGLRAPDEELAARIFARTGIAVPTDTPLYPPRPPRRVSPRVSARVGRRRAEVLEALRGAGPEGMTGAQLGVSCAVLMALAADGAIIETRLGWVHPTHSEAEGEVAA